MISAAVRTWPIHRPTFSKAPAVRYERSSQRIYARVDGVVDEGRFLLMELELIEPALFLADHPAAPSRFADAIANALA